MRVIAGSAKKRRLKSPGKLPVRPTSDRVKESLFNILGSAVYDSSFADLYAGTGAIGIEALSRGARKSLFVEIQPQVLKILNHNLSITGLHESAEVFRGDVANAIKRVHLKNEKFNIIFADPPYRQGLALQTLNMLSKFHVLDEKGVLVMETGADEQLPDIVDKFVLTRQEKYGDTMLNFFKHKSEED